MEVFRLSLFSFLTVNSYQLLRALTLLASAFLTPTEGGAKYLQSLSFDAMIVVKTSALTKINGLRKRKTLLIIFDCSKTNLQRFKGIQSVIMIILRGGSSIMIAPS